jgi:glycolate oxidase FAD binding subunit
LMGEKTNPCLERWSERVRSAVAEKTTIRLRGGGSKDFYGQSLVGELLDTREYSGIVAYEPSELVVTARCGTPLTELEAALAENAQSLAFEPPHFGPEATLGGCVAAGLSGPRRAQAGAVRDFVLGVKMINAQGELLNFGGQVMKNVAGYDVSRLLVGSLGTLGLIVEVSIKVLPVALVEQTLRFDLDQEKSLNMLNRWGGLPLPISASAWAANSLHVRLSGAAAAVTAATAKLGGQRVAPELATAFWLDLREQSQAFFAGDAPLWRLAVPATSAVLPLPGEQLIEWGGAQRWLRGLGTPADQSIRMAAEQAGGHATLFRADAAQKAALGAFQRLSAPLARIHRNLKLAFDPLGVFNRGRLYPDF